MCVSPLRFEQRSLYSSIKHTCVTTIVWHMYKLLYIYVFYQCARDQIKFYVNSVNKDSFVVYKPAG